MCATYPVPNALLAVAALLSAVLTKLGYTDSAANVNLVKACLELLIAAWELHKTRAVRRRLSLSSDSSSGSIETGTTTVNLLHPDVVV